MCLSLLCLYHLGTRLAGFYLRHEEILTLRQLYPDSYASHELRRHFGTLCWSASRAEPDLNKGMLACAISCGIPRIQRSRQML